MQVGTPQFLSGNFGIKKNTGTRGATVSKTFAGMVGQSFGVTRTDEQQTVQKSLATITQKMKTGQKLTDKELKVLQQHAPLEYQKAVLIKEEREQYRRDLERCKTKQEVNETRQQKRMQFVAQQSTIEHSSLNQDQKQEALEFVQMRASAVENEHLDFVKTPKFHRLPENRKKNEMPTERPDPKAAQLYTKTPQVETRENSNWAPQRETTSVPQPHRVAAQYQATLKANTQAQQQRFKEEA